MRDNFTFFSLCGHFSIFDIKTKMKMPVQADWPEGVDCQKFLPHYTVFSERTKYAFTGYEIIHHITVNNVANKNNEGSMKKNATDNCCRACMRLSMASYNKYDWNLDPQVQLLACTKRSNAATFQANSQLP